MVGDTIALEMPNKRALVALTALPLIAAACSDNRLPQIAVPTAEGGRAVPPWYPEAPWSAQNGQSRVLIEGKVVFETDKAIIRPGSEKVLQTLLQFVTEHGEATRLRIEGHTDSTASDEYNQELSARRALAVADWLVDKGVDPERLLAVGFGESKPMAPNESTVGRSENRRTEFHVAEVNGRIFGTKDPTNGGLVLEVRSLEDRKTAAAAATVPTAPAPKSFVPTGDEVKTVGPAPKILVKPRPKGDANGT